MAKIALIGDNSIEFARNDIIGLCGMTDLGKVELALYDTDEPRLHHVAELASLIARQCHSAAVVTAGRDQAEVLDGADYVITELEVGGIEATRADFSVAARYGVRQTDGDTIGIGGIFRGLRTIPVSLNIARDMAARCPHAYLL